jgi:hypothetical protein
MANNLETEKKVLAVSMLAEGNSIRSVERITGIHRDTILRLGIRVTGIHPDPLCDLRCELGRRARRFRSSSSIVLHAMRPVAPWLFKLLPCCFIFEHAHVLNRNIHP